MNKQRLNAVQYAATAAWITFRFGTNGLDCARKTIKSIRHSDITHLKEVETFLSSVSPQIDESAAYA